MALTFNLPSQIVVQTAAQWAVDATVYSEKRILITSDVYYGSTDQRKFKIADGTQTWSNLDYAPFDPEDKNTIGAIISGSSSATPVDTDNVATERSNVVRKVTWTGVKAFLKTYFDTLYKLTFTENTAFNKNFGTGTTNIVEIGSTLGNSQYVKTNSSGKLETQTTAQVKTDLGVITGVQTSLFKTNVNYAHTGTTAETVLYSTANLVGNFDVNDIFKILLNYNCTSNANNKTIKIYLASSSQTQGASFNASGTTQLATYLTTTNGAMKRALLRNIQFMNSLSSQQVVSTTTNGLDNDETALNSAAALSTLTWDYSANTYLIVTGTLASSGDTINFLHFRGQIIR